MPGPETHQIFYKQLKKYLSKDTLSRLPNYDKYSIFAQGHDFLIYHNFYKILSQKRLEKNLYYSKMLQEFYFPEFVCQYIKQAIELKIIDNESVKLFIYGYIGHHILDAHTHPFIIYYSGDHTRNPHNSTWHHGIMENMIDIYMMNPTEQKHFKTYPVHKDFTFDKKIISPHLKDVLDKSLYEIYGMDNGGQAFCEAFSQIKWFMRIFKYDSSGIKRKIFDCLDPVLKGTSSFSYNRKIFDMQSILNENHEVWCNPMDNSIKSSKSFIELYQDALRETAHIIDRLEFICTGTILHEADIYSIIPNIASTHGLECGHEIKILYKKQ